MGNYYYSTGEAVRYDWRLHLKSDNYGSFLQKVNTIKKNMDKDSLKETNGK